MNHFKINEGLLKQVLLQKYLDRINGITRPAQDKSTLKIRKQ